MANNISFLTNHIWSVVDLLRGDFRQNQYGRIILPFTVLRRLECVLAPTRTQVMAIVENTKAISSIPPDAYLLKTAGQTFYNTSKFTLIDLGSKNTKNHLNAYIRAFSYEVREIFEHFNFTACIDLLENAHLLDKVVHSFATVDLSTESVSNDQMILIFEGLIRKFAESSNETAGEHFTPRDILQLTTSLVLETETQKQATTKIERSIYDPTCGTGGFLSYSMEYMRKLNDGIHLNAYGQELNPESFAICKANMLFNGQDVRKIKLGNTLTDDLLPAEKFDYCLSNPPFGMIWKRDESKIRDECIQKGHSGRFGAGLPRVTDGSLLFLQHLISKMKPEGARIGIILNSSPLFIGGAGSGESNIRRYILENDLLDTLVALPTDMFYNTGIAAYIWVLSNKKPLARKDKVLLINATDLDSPIRNVRGSKRKCLSDEAIQEIVRLAGCFEESSIAKIIPITTFGYRQITVERPVKLAFMPHDTDKIASLTADQGWSKLEGEVRQAILNALHNLPERLLCHEQFKKQLLEALAMVNGNVKLSLPVFNLLVNNLSEQCEEAQVCKTKGIAYGRAEMRDYEKVPLEEDIYDYLKREVTPHIPDAFIDNGIIDPIDGKVGIVGYEIKFSKYFFERRSPSKNSKYNYKIKRLINQSKTGEYTLSNSGKIIEFNSECNSLVRFSVDKSKLDVNYYNIFIESEDGRHWLSECTHSLSYKKVSFRDWVNLSLDIPSLKNQVDSCDINEQCNLLLKKISLIKSSIFIDVQSARDELAIYKNLSKRFNNELSSLFPTPLAILWVIVESKSSTHEKCEAYIKFFECLSYYFLSIVTGASNKAKSELSTKIKRSKSITMATPHNVFSCNEKIRPELDSIFHELISDESIRVLKKATELRNDISHRGLPSEKVAREKLSLCEKIMSDMVSLYRDFFESTRLVRAKKMQFDGAIYSCDVEVAKGLALNPCRSDKVKSISPLICGELYITGDEGDENEGTKFTKLSSVLICDEVSEGSGLLGFYFMSDFCDNGLRYFCPYPNVISIKIKENHEKLLLL
ncbi:type I restriction-modification system subunit M [Aeromonas veronii]|uniref:type I restriction-modification system subunit M n=1 Tax=Aeromonas veronii TaxID=654 RepID=UPI003BA17DA4